jgi:hypothetical protein
LADDLFDSPGIQRRPKAAPLSLLLFFIGPPEDPA